MVRSYRGFPVPSSHCTGKLTSKLFFVFQKEGGKDGIIKYYVLPLRKKKHKPKIDCRWNKTVTLSFLGPRAKLGFRWILDLFKCTSS